MGNIAKWIGGGGYSLGETIVGTWIDGKSLYQRVVYLAGTYTSDTNNIDVGLPSSGIIIVACPWISSNDNLGNFVPLAYDVRKIFISSANKVSIRANDTIKNLTICILYTKTTD